MITHRANPYLPEYPVRLFRTQPDKVKLNSITIGTREHGEDGTPEGTCLIDFDLDLDQPFGGNSTGRDVAVSKIFEITHWLFHIYFFKDVETSTIKSFKWESKNRGRPEPSLSFSLTQDNVEDVFQKIGIAGYSIGNESFGLYREKTELRMANRGLRLLNIALPILGITNAVDWRREYKAIIHS